MIFEKDAENSIDGTRKQRGCLKENAKRKDTSTLNQERAGKFLGYVMRKNGLEKLRLIGNIQTDRDKAAQGATYSYKWMTQRSLSKGR